MHWSAVRTIVVAVMLVFGSQASFADLPTYYAAGPDDSPTIARLKGQSVDATAVKQFWKSVARVRHSSSLFRVRKASPL